MPSLLESKLQEERQSFILAKARLKERKKHFSVPRGRVQKPKETHENVRPVLVPIHSIQSHKQLEEDSEEETEMHSTWTDAQLVKQHATVKKLQNELDQEKEQNQLLRSRERELEQEVETKTVLCARYLKQVHDHKDAAAAAAEAIDQLRDELANSKVELDESNHSITKLEEENLSLVEKLENSQLLVTDLRDELAITKDTMTRLEEERQKLHDENVSLAMQQNEGNESNASQQAKVNQLQDRVDELELSLKQHELEKITLKDKLQEAVSEKETLSARATKLHEQVSGTSEAMLQLQGDSERKLHEASLEIRKLQSGSDVLRRQIRNAQQQAAESLEAFQTLATQLVSERSKTANVIAAKNHNSKSALRSLELLEAKMKANFEALQQENQYSEVGINEDSLPVQKQQLQAPQTTLTDERKSQSSVENSFDERLSAPSYDEIVVDIDLPDGRISQLVLHPNKDPKYAVDQFAKTNRLVDRAAQELYAYVKEQLEERWK